MANRRRRDVAALGLLAPALALGLNVVDGKIVYSGVAEAFGMESHDVSTVLG